MVEIEVVVSHVKVEHSVSLVGPDDGIIAAVPDFVGFRTGSKRVQDHGPGTTDHGTRRGKAEMLKC